MSDTQSSSWLKQFFDSIPYDQNRALCSTICICLVVLGIYAGTKYNVAQWIKQSGVPVDDEVVQSMDSCFDVSLKKNFYGLFHSDYPNQPKPTKDAHEFTGYPNNRNWKIPTRSSPYSLH